MLPQGVKVVQAREAVLVSMMLQPRSKRQVGVISTHKSCGGNARHNIVASKNESVKHFLDVQGTQKGIKI